MDARTYRHEAQNLHTKADSFRKQVTRVQQAVETYTHSGDFSHVRSEQDRAAKLEEEAIRCDSQAVRYEQEAAHLEREAAELDRQLIQLRTHYQQQEHALETRIRQLLG